MECRGVGRGVMSEREGGDVKCRGVGDIGGGRVRLSSEGKGSGISSESGDMNYPFLARG